MKKIHFYFFCCCLLQYLPCNSQTIITICGTGTSGYAGDGGPATAAEIGNQGSILTCDLFGNVFFADNGNARIRKISPAGIITTIAGHGAFGMWSDSGPATNSNFAIVLGLTTDATGNIYFTNQVERVIKKISTAGELSVFAGTGGFGWSGDGGPATAAQIAPVGGLCFDNLGNLYFEDSFCIRKVDTHGIITTIAGNPSSSTYSGDGGPATAARFNLADYGFTVNRYRDIFFFDPIVYRIRRIDSNGIITTCAGNGAFTSTGDGGPATAASVNGPSAMGCDTSGNLIFSEESFFKVRKVDRTTGIINIIAGNSTEGFSGDGGPATAAQLVANGLAVNKIGTIFICDDYIYYRIRKIYYPTLGVQDVNVPDGVYISLKPNPANNGAFKIIIATGQPEPATILITDITGQVLKQLDTYSNTPIDIELNAPPGIYMVNVRTATGRWSERVEIRREQR